MNGMTLDMYNIDNIIRQVISIAVLFGLASFSVSAETTQNNTKTMAAKQLTNVLSPSRTTALSIPSTPIEKSDVVVNVDDKSFRCIRKMTPVRHFYVDNLLGNIDGTVAAAMAPKGQVYPVGSVVQLVPTEVMVKRSTGVSPATGDWEFFELEVNNQGSKILKRGFVDVVNRFGGNCFGCHVPARQHWDFICESAHGCQPIPINHQMTGALQRSDPRCGKAELVDGDRMALFKLKAMVTIGLTKKWLSDIF